MTFSPEIILLLTALPFSIIAALTDLRSMKIYNWTNLGLFGVFVIVGIFLFPLEQYGLRLSQGAIMLVVGMIISNLGLMGGGDTKFIAAMAPYIVFNDVAAFVFLLSALSLMTVAAHRGIGMIKPLQPQLVNWKSWSAEKRKFPFGVPLGAALVIYLALKANS